MPQEQAANDKHARYSLTCGFGWRNLSMTPYVDQKKPKEKRSRTHTIKTGSEELKVDLRTLATSMIPTRQTRNGCSHMEKGRSYFELRAHQEESRRELEGVKEDLLQSKEDLRKSQEASDELRRANSELQQRESALEQERKELQEELQSTVGKLQETEEALLREQTSVQRAKFEEQKAAALKSLEALNAKKVTLEQLEADLDEKIAETGEEKLGKRTMKAQKKQYREDLKPKCDWMKEAFDTRRTARQEEMTGLMHAKASLAGGEEGGEEEEVLMQKGSFLKKRA